MFCTHVQACHILIKLFKKVCEPFWLKIKHSSAYSVTVLHLTCLHRGQLWRQKAVLSVFCPENGGCSGLSKTAFSSMGYPNIKKSLLPKLGLQSQNHQLNRALGKWEQVFSFSLVAERNMKEVTSAGSYVLWKTQGCTAGAVDVAWGGRQRTYPNFVAEHTSRESSAGRK